jgi:hypothetical protein
MPDPARVLCFLRRGLQRPPEGDKPDEGQGREKNQAKPEEGRSQAACGRHQAQGDEAAGNRREEHVRPTGRLGDRRGARALEHKVLGGHERDRRGARVALVGAARVAVDRGFTSSLAAQVAAPPAAGRRLRGLLTSMSKMNVP